MTFPRRHQMQRWCAGERLIQEAVDEVERMGADVRLTDAVNLLGAARDRVADFIDMVDGRRMGACSQQDHFMRPVLLNDALGGPTWAESWSAMRSAHPAVLASTRAEQLALLCTAIAQTGLSNRQYAEQVLLRDERTLRRWLSGKQSIPAVVLRQIALTRPSEPVHSEG